jgi:hypothetical protein
VVERRLPFRSSDKNVRTRNDAAECGTAVGEPRRIIRTGCEPIATLGILAMGMAMANQVTYGQNPRTISRNSPRRTGKISSDC